MAKVKVRGKGSVYKMERGKPRAKCRKWQLRAEIEGEFEGDEGYVKTRVFHGTYSEAQDAKDEFVAAIERGEVRRERGDALPRLRGGMAVRAGCEGRLRHVAEEQVPHRVRQYAPL